jgi:hypothetical protein
MFRIRIRPPHIREAQIRQSAQASTEVQDFYDFRSARAELKKVRIPQDMLLYRMENFRTFIDQQAYISREQKPHNFFVAGQENESVQQVQHGILGELARRGRADSIVPVIDVLKKEKQREPLLITHRGVVVNGNRRLAAMRELLDENGHLYEEFNHISCLVLPEDATPEDIVEIEAGLQARPETKLDYDWIGDAQLIRKLMSLGRTERQLADRLRRKPAEIRNLLAALSEANLYLKEWREAEGDYTLVRDSEQFFKDLPGLLHGKDQALADASRVIAWTLHDNRDSLNERLYAFNVAIGKQAAEVVDRLTSQMGVPTDPGSDDAEDDFAIDIDEGSDDAVVSSIADLLTSDETKQEAVEALIDISRSVLERERGRKTGTAAVKAIGTANARLMEVDLARAEPGTYATIGKQLDQIVHRATVLKSVLAALMIPDSDLEGDE